MNQFLRTLSAGLAISISHMGTGSAEELECPKLCKEKPENCLEVAQLKAPDAGEEIPDALKKVHEKLLDPEVEKITRKELLEAFGLVRDDCHRSDTTISTYPPKEGLVSRSHRLWNSGSNCRIAASISLPSGNSMKAGFLIPEILSADFQIEDQVVVLQPTPTEIPPLVHFSKPAFSKDFGGRIEFVSFGVSESFVQTKSGCIWIKP